jgi:hypothetical protein
MVFLEKFCWRTQQFLAMGLTPLYVQGLPAEMSIAAYASTSYFSRISR